jgi:hypothetical protein
MAYDLHEQAETRPTRQWPAALAWPLVVLVGLLLFELTAQPALAVIALCLKLGWNDFRTAWWLRRRDPSAGRGWACLFLYASSGLWKVTLTGFALMVVLVVGLAIAVNAAGPQPGPAVDVEDQLMAALLTGLLGSALAMPLTCAAVLAARVSRAKLWLNGGVHEARRKDRWPPPDAFSRGVNRIGLLTLAVLIVTWLAVLGLAIALVAGGARPGRNNRLGALSFAVVLTAWGAGIYVIYLVQNYCERAVFARSPRECWGVAVPADRMAGLEGLPATNAPGSPRDACA